MKNWNGWKHNLMKKILIGLKKHEYLCTVSRYVIRTDKLIWPPRIMHFRNLLDIEKLKKHLKSWFTGTTFLSLITNQLEFNLFSSFQISVCFFSHWQMKVLRAFCLFWSAISWCWVIIQARLILSTSALLRIMVANYRKLKKIVHFKIF